MFEIGCKEKYKVLHINNEIGEYVLGGAGTYMNELYKYKLEDEGFIHVKDGEYLDDICTNKYPEPKDIYVIHPDESYKIAQLNCDIIVIQFYEYADYINEEIIKNKKLVYVIHSVPTPEPMPLLDPFGGNHSVRVKFEKLCKLSHTLVCVSEAEKKKLIFIYPHLESKIKVIHNGITYSKIPLINDNYTTSRRKFGYIGRTDYRKGILEFIREFKDIDAEIHLACPKNDPDYLRRILEYIKATGMEKKVIFHGWCVGERKKNFFKSLDALIIPSLYEPFGYVALEAIKNGVPIISSNRGGLNEIMGNYKYKYNPYHVGALKGVLNEFINDDISEINDQMQILIKRFYDFNAEKMCKKYHELWEQIIDS